MKILIVDDDEMVLESLDIILSTDPTLEIIGKATNGNEAIEFCEKNSVDLVLMDIQMPVMDGIGACRAIKKINPDIKIIMLTTFKDYKNINQSLHAGASGYLLKSDDTEKQIMTIKTVYAGLPIISEEALKSFSKSKIENRLTPREKDILELIANGFSNNEIAQQLYIGEGTVRNIISIILDKLELRDRAQLAIYYWKTKVNA